MIFDVIMAAFRACFGNRFVICQVVAFGIIGAAPEFLVPALFAEPFQQSAFVAFGAFHPGCKRQNTLASRIVDTTVKLAEPAFAYVHIRIANRTAYTFGYDEFLLLLCFTHLGGKRLSKITFGILGASQEPALFANFNRHWRTAFLAWYFGYRIRFLGFFERMSEWVVKLIQHISICLAAVGNFIEFIFHFGSKFHIEKVGEIHDEHLVYIVPEVSGDK